MEVNFKCQQSGRRYFSVWRQGREVFVGTRGEVGRYLALHRRKVITERRMWAEGRVRPLPFLPPVRRALVP